MMKGLCETAKLTLGIWCFLTWPMAAAAQMGGTGWVQYPVNFHVQWPTNAAEDTRYFATNNIYHCLVFSNDGAFAVGNTTLPRTEQRFEPDYTNGEIQYQSSIMAPSNENSYCVFQIHTGDAQSDEYGSTTFMLFWFTNSLGSVRDYSGTVLATNLGNRWFQLNVDHNLNSHLIKVWINQSLVWTQLDNGAGDFYFKDGVYEQDHGPTLEMDSYITNILMWTNSRAVSPLTWTGQTNGVGVSNWDQGITADWVNSTNQASAVYQDGSPVKFDDTAPGLTTVAVQTLVLPGSVTVSNNIKSYMLEGSGTVGGLGGLSKYGSGSLLIETSNSFSGGVLISGGILQAGNAAALGATNGMVVITNGGTLDVDGMNLTAQAVTVSGAGAGSNGAIINSGPQQTSALRNVTLTADTTFGGVNRWDIRNTGGNATLSFSPPGAGFSLFKTGPNQVSLVGVSNIDSSLGNIVVEQGTFAVQTSTVQLGDPTKTLSVAGGAILELWTLTASPLNKQIVFESGSTVYNEKAPSVIVGPISLQGDATFNLASNGSPPMLTLSNLVSGPGSLVVTGGGTLVLTATNTYMGTTMVSQGTLSMAGSGSIGGSASIRVQSGAILDASGRTDETLTLNSGQTLTGNGTINGNAVIGNGATLAPGGSLSVMTFNTNLLFNSGSTALFEVSKSPTTNDVAQVKAKVTYGGTLMITNRSSHPLVSGDSFKLFNASVYGGAFTNIVPPTPGSGLAWNLNGLSNGVLSVAVAAPPRIGTAQLTGGNLVVSGSGGPPNGAYCVLSSTNAALAAGLWSAIATNSFDGNGNFNFTIAPLTQAQDFFRLRLQ